MDYKEKYEYGLECIQEILSGAGDLIRTTTLRKRLEPFFPELKESEDERIRKAILQFFELQDDNTTYSFVPKQNIINWLEKQKDYIKLPNSAYTSNRDVIEFADKYSHTIWEKLMDNFKKIENYSIGCNDVSDIVLNSIINTYNWIKKQGSQKPVNKPTPKFKVRDFIANDYCSGKIIEITNDAYLLDTGQGIPFSCEHNAHLWSINDAKDGDVLQLGEVTAIFQEYIGNENCKCYCSVCDGNFEIPIKNGEDNIYGCTNTTPATKEQCDLLFKKMKETGYAWDNKKKELKKIEQKPDNVESKFNDGNWIVGNEGIFKITHYEDEHGYDLTDTTGCVVHFVCPDYVESNFHLWTIEDAKKGDVLVHNGCPFIFMGIKDGIVQALEENLWEGTNPVNFGEPKIDKDYQPSIKEQQELLFQKIKDTGYEWDADKKELKKIEPKILGADDILPYLGNNQVQDILEDMGMLDDNGYCPHTAEEIFKAGMEHAFNLNRETASSVKLDVKNI